MSKATNEPKLLFPQLKPFYDRVEPLAWTLVRLTAGLMILPHGLPKLIAGVEATAQMALVRKKDMVISGGENIYPVEIEAVLLKHPKVRDAAVIGSPDDRLGEVVTAVIEPKEGDPLTKEEASSFCEGNLPRYKRPRHIFFDQVPRSPSGKIEKTKLREKYGKQK